MKCFIASLIAIMLVVMGGITLAQECSTVYLSNVDNETKVVPDLDSQQPDTIYYDDGTGHYLWNGAVNWWGTVRFTCPANFELRSVYVMVLNQYNAPEGCDVYVYADNNGNPGALLGGPYHINGPFGTTFLDAEVTDSLNFDEGDDFHVIYGPAPGGTYQVDPGWWLYLDANTTTNRSRVSPNQGGPWQSLPGDLFVRAGGDLEGYTDIACNFTFTDPANWFVEEGATLDIKAAVQNVGTENISSYDIAWTIRDEGGSQVWTSSGSYGALSSGSSATQTAPDDFTATTEGYYEIESNVTTTGDVNNENDIHLMELGVGDLGWGWMKYDDGSLETPISSPPGNGWGQRFDPVAYSAQVDSIMVNLGSAATVTDIRIFNLDVVGQSFTELWDYTGAVNQGWNTFSFSPDEVVIHEPGVFVVAYIFQEGCNMMKDDNVPNAASNANMPATSYTVSGYGSSMDEDDSGDWGLRIFCSESSLIPPDPVLETSTDTLDFGAVTINQSADLSFWVRNAGGGDPLTVTNIQPQLFSAYYDISPTSFTLQQNDSTEVTVTFTPAATQSYDTHLGIFWDPGTYYLVRVLGSGTTVSVHDPDHEVLPDQFSLAQNYPNPFNPSTEIRFALPVGSMVKLTVFNTLGQEVATLTNTHYPAGTHAVQWNAGNVPSGIYFYRMEAGNFTDMKKMVLTK